MSFSCSVPGLKQMLMHGQKTDLSVHGGHGFRDALHCHCHTVVRLERLDLETDCLDIGSHHYKLLDIAPRANQVLSHYFDSILQTHKTTWWQNTLTRIRDTLQLPFSSLDAPSELGFVNLLLSNHLSLFGHFLNVSDDFLLLLLQLLPLFVQISHGSVEGPLVLPQHLLRCLSLPEEELHLWKPVKGHSFRYESSRSRDKELNLKKNKVSFHVFSHMKPWNKDTGSNSYLDVSMSSYVDSIDPNVITFNQVDLLVSKVTQLSNYRDSFILFFSTNQSQHRLA